MLSMLLCFYQNLVLVAEYHVDCWQTLLWRLLWQIFGATNWSEKQTSKRTVTWKIFFGISRPTEKIRYFKHRKYQNFWTNNKDRGNKNAICFDFLPYVLNICRKLKFFIFQGIVTMPKVRWVISYGFCSKFHTLSTPAVQKFWKSVKISQSYREFKGGNFFRHSVECVTWPWPCPLRGQLVIWRLVVIVAKPSDGSRGFVGFGWTPPLRPDPVVVAENAQTGCNRLVH